MREDVAPGRLAFERGAWSEAFDLLAASAFDDVDDLQRLAVSAHLVGRDDECARAWERAHAACLSQNDPGAAARCAVWLGIGLILGGEMARAAGWLARADRLVEGGAGDHARGFTLMPKTLFAIGQGSADTALALAEETISIGQRTGDPDLVAMGLLGSGQAKRLTDETAAAMKLFDEAMVSVTSGEVSPIPSGIIYCAVIEACMGAFDMGRASEWTQALHTWCTDHPDLVPYRGQCLVHRSQVLQAHGDWADAASEVEEARRRLSDPAHPALGLALYQQGELHRVRGDFSAARRAYRAASEHGHDPVPGQALLRLAEGDVDAAVAGVQRMLEECRSPETRARVLIAAVEILSAADDRAAAAAASRELADLAGRSDAPPLRAASSWATGLLRLREGAASDALIELRRAATTWRSQDMPYEEARARVHIAQACRELGDVGAADMEEAAARSVFVRLGADPDLASIVSPDQRTPASVLTDRECEVLRLVAAGKTNRAVAAELTISQHTVARHLQNIFTKLDLPSRAAATAFAYEHGLV